MVAHIVTQEEDFKSYAVEERRNSKPGHFTTILKQVKIYKTCISIIKGTLDEIIVIHTLPIWVGKKNMKVACELLSK